MTREQTYRAIVGGDVTVTVTDTQQPQADALRRAQRQSTNINGHDYIIEEVRELPDESDAYQVTVSYETGFETTAHSSDEAHEKIDSAFPDDATVLDLWVVGTQRF